VPAVMCFIRESVPEKKKSIKKDCEKKAGENQTGDTQEGSMKTEKGNFDKDKNNRGRSGKRTL